MKKLFSLIFILGAALASLSIAKPELVDKVKDKIEGCNKLIDKVRDFVDYVKGGIAKIRV